MHLKKFHKFGHMDNHLAITSPKFGCKISSDNKSSEIMCRQYLFQFQIIISVKMSEVKPIIMEVIEIYFFSDSVYI